MKAILAHHLSLHHGFVLLCFILIGMADFLPLRWVECFQPLLQVSQVQAVLLLHFLKNSIECHVQLLLLLLQTLAWLHWAHCGTRLLSWIHANGYTVACISFCYITEKSCVYNYIKCKEFSSVNGQFCFKSYDVQGMIKGLISMQQIWKGQAAGVKHMCCPDIRFCHHSMVWFICKVFFLAHGCFCTYKHFWQCHKVKQRQYMQEYQMVEMIMDHASVNKRENIKRMC